MRDLEKIKNIYDKIKSVIPKRYKYEGKQFIDFIKRNDLGFTFETLESWKDYLIKKDYKARTINKYLLVGKNAFKAVFSANEDHFTVSQKNEIDRALSEIKRVKEPKVNNILSRILSKEEIELFIKLCKNTEIALMLEFLYCTGCRVSEMLNIKQKDLEQIEPKIYSIRILGKGLKERYTYISMELLVRIKEFFNNTEYLFQYKGRRRSRSYVSMNIKRLCTKLIGKNNISAHILRHSFCTQSLENGLSLEHVRIMAGHSDIQTTSKYYSHIIVKQSQFLNVNNILHAT